MKKKNTSLLNFPRSLPETKRLHPETLMMSYGYKPELSEGAVKCPIFQTSTFAFKTAEEGKNFFALAYGLREKKQSKDEIIKKIKTSGLSSKLSMIYIETPANPTNSLFDISMGREIANKFSTKEKKVVVVAAFLNEHSKHAVVMQLSFGCHAVVMQLSCSCHAVVATTV